MTKNRFLLIKFSLGLLILFSFSTIVKAYDYELLIITSAKFETVAQSFLTMHQNAGDVGQAKPMYGAYVTVENIVAAYDNLPSGVLEPSPADPPPVPATPTLIPTGFDYPPPGMTPLPNLCIVKLLRGLLQLKTEGLPDGTQTNGIDDYVYAFNILQDATGAFIPLNSWDFNNGGINHPKFLYLLLLGETGAGSGGAMTFNGVPESWYVWMNFSAYPGYPFGDGTWFPTDFFYASPDYGGSTGGGIDWVPNLRVGRIPVHDLLPVEDSGTVTEITAIPDTGLNPYNFDECDVCDSTKTWVASGWVGDELWIVSDGNPPATAGGTGTAAPIGATYQILDNTDTCLLVLGDPSAVGLEAEDLSDTTHPIPGDGYEIHDNGLVEAQAIFTKCNNYLTAVAVPNAWSNWFRKVVTAGGDSHPSVFAFWDEFVLADITNQGFFEGNNITKLRHTNWNDGVAGNDFNDISVAPYLNDTDCGLLFELGYGTDTTLIFDGSRIDRDDVLGYTSSDSKIPIVVSNAGMYSHGNSGSGGFDRNTPSFGEAVVESPTGGGIAYIGLTSSAWQGIIPFFDNGVLYQDRLFDMDELLSYTMRSFNNAPKYIGDLVYGSPTVPGGLAQGPINSFIENNDMTHFISQKTVWEYTLFGDPALPIPYPQLTPIETQTSAPSLALSNLRTKLPQYESHDIGVDEIPTGGSAVTTVGITTPGRPVGSSIPPVKITRMDIRRDIGIDFPAPASPADYTFSTLNTVPGYYFVKVEQPGYDNLASNWGTWWEKESWIYVQEVNEFTPTNTGILVVDDDFGYPLISYYFNAMIDITSAVPSNIVYGYEDWYLKTLDDLGQSYDIWHVDFDDTLTHYPGKDDAWGGTDAGDALMNGEIYNGLLDNYDKVIWLTGDYNGYWRPYFYDDDIPDTPIWMTETLTGPEQALLEDYLDNHAGRLFLSGQGILLDLGCAGRSENAYWCERKNDTSSILNTFLTGYMHISDVYSSLGYGNLTQLKSISGNPVIDDNYGIDIAGPYGAQNQFLFVDAEPETDTPIVRKIFEYDFSGGGRPDTIEGSIGDTPFFGTAGTAYYQGRGASVFLPWGFEAISDQHIRSGVMTAILAWLGTPAYTGAGEDEGGGGTSDGGGDGTDTGTNGGGGGRVGKLSGCFIATACYGTPMAKEVRVLSEFRDEYLITNSLGKIFVGTYYKVSPRIASFISEHPLLKEFVRAGLKPIVYFSEKLVVSREKND